MVLIGN